MSTSSPEDIFGSAMSTEKSGESRQDLIADLMDSRTTSQLNVEVPKKLHKKLRIYSAVSDREIRSIVADALIEYLADK